MTTSIIVTTQTSASSGSLQVLDLGTAALKKEVLLPDFVPGSIEFAPNGNLLVGRNGWGVSGFDFKEFNSNTLQPVNTAFTGSFLSVGDVEFGPNGILYVDDNTDVLQFNPQTGTEIGNITDAASGGFITTNFAFGPDGNIYAHDSIDNGITVFEPIGGSVVKIFPVFQGLPVTDLAFNLQGVLHVIRGSEVQTVKVEQVLVNSKLVDKLVTTTVVSGLIVPKSLSFGPNGNLFVAEGGTNTVKEYDAGYNLVRNISVNGSPIDVDFGVVNLVASGGATEGSDRVTGTAAADTLSGLGGNDRIVGKGGNDKLSGGEGNDQLFGDEGNDTLKGEAGNDKLFGGIGKNQLFGGADRDTFVLNKGEGFSVIKDFEDGKDKLKLQGMSFRQIDIFQRGANVVISFQGDQIAALQKVRAGSLTSSDF